MKYIRRMCGLVLAALAAAVMLMPVKAQAATPKYTKTKATIYVGNGIYDPTMNGVRDDAEITFESSKTSVATVDSEGRITPKKAGSATITATIVQAGKTYTSEIKITVKKPYFKITQQTSAVLTGGSFVFDVKRYGYSGSVEWSLEGSQYAYIRSTSATACMLTGLSEGTVKLTVKSNGTAETITVNVYEGNGELYCLSPDSTPYYPTYASRADYNEKTKHYFLIRSYLERLEAVGGGVLVLTKGEYVVTNTLCVPSNTKIILEDGVTVKKSSDTGTENLTATGSMFQTIGTAKGSAIAQKLAPAYKGYDGEHDIEFIGYGNATIDLNFVKSNAIAACHVTNLSITGISFKNLNSLHFLEIDASQNVLISHNSFMNCVTSPTLRKEAINIDAPDANIQSFNQSWTSMDGTPVVNVTISDNVFYNLEAGIGTHKYSTGGMHSNITIVRNQFIDVTSYSICAMNWQKFTIKDNTFERTYDVKDSETGVEVGVLLYGVSNPTVTENYFSNCSYPIICRHWQNTGGGSQYPPIYNEFSNANIAALQRNYVCNCENDKVKDYYNFTDLSRVKYYTINLAYVIK